MNKFIIFFFESQLRAGILMRAKRPRGVQKRQEEAALDLGCAEWGGEGRDGVKAVALVIEGVQRRRGLLDGWTDEQSG